MLDETRSFYFEGETTTLLGFPSFEIGSAVDMSVHVLTDAITVPAGTTVIIDLFMSNNNVNWVYAIRMFDISTVGQAFNSGIAGDKRLCARYHFIRVNVPTGGYWKGRIFVNVK